MPIMQLMAHQVRNYNGLEILLRPIKTEPANLVPSHANHANTIQLKQTTYGGLKIFFR
jgi:hypothetical protein